MRRTLVLAALAAGLCAPHAQAAPTATVDKAALAAFHLTTATHQLYVVEVLASVPQTPGSSPVVRLSVEAPDGTRSLYSAPVPASALSVSDKAASLRTTIGSLPLTVSWTADAYALAASFGNISGRDGGLEVSGWTAAGNGAHTVVQVGSATCALDWGIVGAAAGHDTDGFGTPTTQALKGVPAKGLRCAEIPSTPFPIVP